MLDAKLRDCRRWCTGAGLTLALSVPAKVAQAQQLSKEECVAAHSAAQDLRADGKLREARDKLLLCAHAECPTIARTDCSTWLTQIQNDIPSVVLVATDASGHDITDVKVFEDGQPLVSALSGQPVLINPGTHTLRFEREGEKPLEQKLVIRTGERNRAIKIQFGSPPSPEPSVPAGAGTTEAAPVDTGNKPVPLPTWVLGGVGLVGIAGFAFFALDGRSKESDLEACEPNCAHDDVQAARRSYLIGDISGIL